MKANFLFFLGLNFHEKMEEIVFDSLHKKTHKIEEILLHEIVA